jgi:hypothetical protein
MELYVCEENMNTSPTGEDKIFLLEHFVQSRKMKDSSSIDFNVPPSTKALTIFVQSGLSGQDNRFPPSKFTVENGLHKHMRNLQISFANVTKPPTNWTSETGAHTQKLQQRYLDTQIESGQAFSSGGCETMSDWLLNGPIYHYSFIRDAEDRSTQVQISCNFDKSRSVVTAEGIAAAAAAHVLALAVAAAGGGPAPVLIPAVPIQEIGPNDNIFLVAHYTRQIDIQIESGFISSVTSLNI